MPEGSRLSVSLLGAPVVDVDGRPLVVDTRKAIALLVYLAVTARAARRDTLTGLLWPEASPDRARAALRRTMSALRTALGSRWLEVSGDTVFLARAGVDLDVAEFRALLAGAPGHDDLVAAVALHRGDFLAGFGLRDSAAFDDWQQLETDTLRRELADALDLLAESHAVRGEHRLAIECARRRLGLDPLHEPAHRILIRLLAAGGERAAALEQYRSCVRVLDRELGVRPLDETTALYHAILEGTHVLPPAAQPPEPAPGSERSYALVGREREWRALTAAYDSVGPDGRLVVVVGEAGIGKTRLGEEVTALVASRGGTTLGVRCFEEEADLAYGVVIELVRAALAAAESPMGDPWWLGEAARLLPELGAPPPGTVDSIAAQARFYEAVCELLLHAVGTTPPGVVFVDDAHWADEASLGLLGYLAHRLRGRPVLVVASWRPEEVSREHPLRRLLAEAHRDRSSHMLMLGRLSAADVASLVGAAGRNGELGPRLYRESGGLPFFVVEYLDAIGREGADEPDWPVPSAVRDLLGSRLETLGELAEQVVAAAAVLGRSFEPDTVRDTSGRSDDEIVVALEELVARGLLVEGPDGRLDFRHKQLRDLVYGEMTAARRRLLHRRTAAALEDRGDRQTQAALVAHHHALAGDDAAAADLYRVAGDRARALFANVEALAHYRAALALGHRDAAGLHLAIGDLETLAGDYGDALASYQTAAALAQDASLSELEHRIGLLHLRRGEWELADASLAAALERLPVEASARALADRSLAAHRRGNPDDAGRWAVEALELAERAGDAPALAQARNILGILAASRGEHVEAAAHLEKSLALARDAADSGAEAAALNNLALAVGGAGDRDRALELTDAALTVCSRLGDRHREAALRNNRADLLHLSGRREEAMAELKLAVALFAEVGEEGKLEPAIWKLSEW